VLNKRFNKTVYRRIFSCCWMALCLIVISGCTGLFQSNEAKEKAENLESWTCTVSSSDDEGDSDAPSKENRTTLTLSSSDTSDSSSLPVVFDTDSFESALPEGLTADSCNTITDTDCWLGSSLYKLTAESFTIVTDANNAVSGIYGIGGGLDVTKLGYVFDNVGKFWFAKGSVINSALFDEGSETLPLLDGSDDGEADRTYMVFLLNGISQICNNLFNTSLSDMFVVVFDPNDPLVYFSKYDGLDQFISVLKKASGDTSKETSKTSKSKKATGKGSGGLEFELDAFGFSYNGLLPVGRKVLWPFNCDADGIVFTDDYGQLLTTEQIKKKNSDKNVPDDYSPFDSFKFKRSTDTTDTFIFKYGDDETTTKAQSDTDNDEIPVASLSNLYIEGETDLLPCGLPFHINGDMGLTYYSSADASAVPESTDPPGAYNDAFDLEDPAYLRFVSNGTVTLNVKDDLFKKSKLKYILKNPELGSCSLLANIGPDRSYAYFSLESNENEELGDYVDLSAVGLVSDDFESVLSDFVVSSGPDCKLAFFFDVRNKSDFDWMFRTHDTFELNPGAVINYAVSEAAGKDLTVFDENLSMVGDIAFGDTGFYACGIVDSGFSLTLPDSSLSLSFGGDADVSAWIISKKDWGVHFGTTLGIELPVIGNLSLTTASVDFNSDYITVSGNLDFNVSHIITSSGTVAGNIVYSPCSCALEGNLSVLLLDFLSYNADVSVSSSGGVSMTGNIDIDTLGEVTVAGSFSPQKERFSLAGSAELSVGKVNFTGLTVSLSNDGVFASGKVDIPDVTEVAVSGEITSSGFTFTGSTDLTIAGYTLEDSKVSCSNSGIAIDGTLSIPDIVTTEISGTVQYDGNISLSGSGNVKIGNTTLLNAKITLTGNLSSGDVSVYINSTYCIPTFASFDITGNVSIGDSDVFSAAVSGKFSAAKSIGFPFPQLGFNLTLKASASLDVIVTIKTDNPCFSLDGSGSVSVTYPWVEVTWKSKKVNCGLVSITVYYATFKWTTETSSASLKNLSVSTSSISFTADLPVIGSTSFELP
jgi:hypothetical protein